MTACPSGRLRSTARLRLLRLKAAKKPAPKPPSPRVWSPLRRRLDLDHVGAELGEDQPGGRAHHRMAEFEDLEAGQRQRAHARTRRMGASRPWRRAPAAPQRSSG